MRKESCNSSLKVIIANDHGAIELKKIVVNHLKRENFTVEDLGVNSQESVDYPDMAERACRLYLEGGYSFGILLCGTGIGISIAANKIAGIRCALLSDSFSAQMAREHNNANFIALGGRQNYPEPIETILNAFFHTEYKEGRHQLRIDKITALETCRRDNNVR